jgi:hypothetical protein
MLHEHNDLWSRPKYPIFFCRIVGRIISPTKPTKRKPNGGTKETPFTIQTSLKFNEEGTEPITLRSYVLWEKYKPKPTDTVVFDTIEKLEYMTFTYIKD